MAITPETRSAIIRAYRGICQWCHAPGADHIDHIIPKAGGGTGNLENLTLACKACNLKKSDMVIETPYIGIVLGRAQKKSPVIERLLKSAPQKKRKLKTFIEPIPRVLKFEEIDPFWTEVRLLALLTRCAQAVSKVPVVEDIPVLMRGSLKEAYDLGISRTSSVVSFHDVMRDVDLGQVGVQPMLQYCIYAADRPTVARHEMGCGNLITRGESTTPGAWVLYTSRSTTRLLLKIYAPQTLANFIVSGLTIWIGNEEDDETPILQARASSGKRRRPHT